MALFGRSRILFPSVYRQGCLAMLTVPNRTFRSTGSVRFRKNIVKICRDNNIEKALAAYHQIRDKNETLTTVEYNYLLQCASRNDRIDKVAELFSEQKQISLPNEKSFAIVMNCFTKSNLFKESIKLFETLSKYNITADLALNSLMIANHFGNNDPDAAFELFEDLKNTHHTPDEIAYSRIIIGSSTANLHDKALHYLKEMIEIGFTPSITDFNRVIRGLSYSEQFRDAISVFELMISCNVIPQPLTFELLANRYAATNQFHHVITVTKLMAQFDTKPTVAFFTKYILEGFMKKQYEAVLTLYEESKKFEVELPVEYYTPVLKSCDALRDFERTWKVYRELKKHGYRPQIDAFFSVVFGCCESGTIEHVKVLLEDMKMFNYTIKSTRQWTSLLSIAAKVENGAPNTDTAFELYYAMLDNARNLDELPFGYMARVCHHNQPPLAAEMKVILDTMKDNGISVSAKFAGLLRNLGF